MPTPNITTEQKEKIATICACFALMDALGGFIFNNLMMAGAAVLCTFAWIYWMFSIKEKDME